MKIYYLFILILLYSCQLGQKKQDENEWIQLFNGKDLSGWDIKISGFDVNNNYKNTFYVEDGILTASYENYDKFNSEFGHLITKKEFSHYKLRIEYRFFGEQVDGGPDWALFNNGAMLHSQSAESMLIDQDFHVSVEAQFLGGHDENERTTSNVCTPGTHIVLNGNLITGHCTSSNSKTYPAYEWVTAEIIVRGDSIIHHILEGDTVLTYTKPQIGGDLPEGFHLSEGTLLKKGHIAIQAESHSTRFRKIELLDLSKQN